MGAKIFKMVVIALVLAGAVWLAGHWGTKKQEAVQTLPPAIKLKLFQSPNPSFNFTFEYPEAWSVAERGYVGEYEMAEVLGVTDKDPNMYPAMFFTRKSLKAGESLNGLMESWLKTEGHYKNFKVLSSQAVTVAGQKGVKAEYTYVLSLPLWSSNAKEVAVRKEQNILVRGEAVYQIAFAGTEEQMKIYKPVFRRALETFQFAD